MKGTSVIIAFVLIACASADIQSDVTNLLNNEDLSKIPALEGFDTSQFNLTQVPTVEDAERVFKDKCLKHANLEAYEHALGAKDVLQSCVQGLVNFTVLQDEMDLAKPTGDLDMVFKKYCRKSPELRACVSNFTSTMEPCLDEAERESKHIIQNVTDSLLQFVCFKEGDRIALFIAEGGPDCLQSHQEDVQLCVNQTFTKRMPSATLSIHNLPRLVLGVDECKDLRSLQKCVVERLETCKEPTPGNIVDAMFNFVYKVTPCAKITREAQRLSNEANGITESAAAGGVHASAVLFASALSLLAVKLV